MSPEFGPGKCLMFAVSTFADDMCDVFLKKGFVFTKVDVESLDSNADRSNASLCSAPLDYCA